MIRQENWEKRLADFIEENRNAEFKRGVFDCVFFTSKAVEAMTGQNFVKNYVNSYKTKKEGFALLKKEGINNLSELAESRLGKPLSNINFAARGDVVVIEHNGEQGMGVIDTTGRRAVTIGQNGLLFLPKEFWLKAWGI